jgi:hypothetical protein
MLLCIEAVFGLGLIWALAVLQLPLMITNYERRRMTRRMQALFGNDTAFYDMVELYK